MIHAQNDFDSGKWFESKSYGWRVPDELWAEYLAAQEEVSRLSDLIDACEVDPYPEPTPGSPGYYMWKSMRDFYTESLQHAASVFKSRDDAPGR